MSKYFVCEPEYSNKDLIIEVLREMGLSPRIENDGVLLEDYQGSTKQNIRAHIVVPRAQVGAWSNDWGFVRQANGAYKFVLDEETGHHGMARKSILTNETVAFHQAFQHAYTLKETERQLRVRGITGFRLDRAKTKVEANGRVQVVLRR